MMHINQELVRSPNKIERLFGHYGPQMYEFNSIADYLNHEEQIQITESLSPLAIPFNGCALISFDRLQYREACATYGNLVDFSGKILVDILPRNGFGPWRWGLGLEPEENKNLEDRMYLFRPILKHTPFQKKLITYKHHGPSQAETSPRFSFGF